MADPITLKVTIEHENSSRCLYCFYVGEQRAGFIYRMNLPGELKYSVSFMNYPVASLETLDTCRTKLLNHISGFYRKSLGCAVDLMVHDYQPNAKPFCWKGTTG